MKRTLSLLAIGASALVGAAFSTAAFAQAKAEVSISRIECGTPPAPMEVNLRFSDTYEYAGKKVPFVFSCYLIKHGDDYLLWDTGHAMTAGAVAPKVSLVDVFAKENLKPEQIKFIGISHYHADHTGQVGSFPGATLLIGSGDWAAITAPTPAPGVNAPPFAHWATGGGKVEPLSGDKDVFGDGSVVILSTPGHTPGHRALLVRLAKKGNFLISGDLVHFHENYKNNGVPTFNVSRAETLASIDRFKKLAKVHKAKVVIQHDARDVGILPAYPAVAN